MELEQRRLRAMTLLEQGRSQAEVAAMYGVTPAAVSQWRSKHRRGGEAALRAKRHPGRTPKLNGAPLRKLEKLLRRGAVANGYATELWTLKRVAEVIQKHFAVHYDPSGVWHLFQRMNWSCQKPETRARERDEQAIARWRAHDWPRIKKRAT